MLRHKGGRHYAINQSKDGAVFGMEFSLLGVAKYIPVFQDAEIWLDYGNV
jgi:hypothetical protein